MPYRRSHIPTLLSFAIAGSVLLSGCGNQPSEAPASASSSESALSSNAATGRSPSPRPAATPAESSSQAQATVGALVEGFPTGILPVMPGAQVTQNAFDSSQDPASASLVLSTQASAQEVTDFYTKVFRDQGFTQLPGDTIDNVPTRDFVRQNGAENVSVSVVSDSTGNTVTLGAKIAAASLK